MDLMNWSLPRSINQSLDRRMIDLNNYYKNDRERRIIQCHICEYDVPSNDVYEHTVSKRHKYNKLFIAILQDTSYNIDVDFVVLEIDRLQCRYCDSLILNTNRGELVIHHIQDDRHIKKKQDYLNRSSARVSTLEYKLLQPLDSLITHDKVYEKSINKSVKKLKMRKRLLEKTELVMKEPSIINDVEQKNARQNLAFFLDYQRQRGQLPKCITIREGSTCICTICLIEIPKSTYNVGGHIDGKKHKNKVLESLIFTDEKLEIIEENKLLPVPPKLSEENTQDLRDRNKIVQDNVPQCVTFLKGKQVQSRKELSDHISLEENGALTCTVCIKKIPNSVYNMDQHVNGKKHIQETQKFLESTQLKLKLKDMIQPKSAPNTNTKNETYMCTICVKMIVNHKHSIQQHNKSKKHKRNMLEFGESTDKHLESQDMNKSMLAPNKNTKNKTYMCTICVKMITNNERNIEEHNNGNTHKENVLKSLESTRQKLKSHDTDQSMLVSTSNVKNASYMCTICVMMVPNHARSVKIHENGKNHKKKLLLF